MPLVIGPVTYTIKELIDSRHTKIDKSGITLTLEFRVEHTETVYVTATSPPLHSPLTQLYDRLGNSLYWTISDAIGRPTFYLEDKDVQVIRGSGGAYCHVTLVYRENWQQPDNNTRGENEWREAWSFDFTAKQTHVDSVPDPSYQLSFPSTRDAGLAINKQSGGRVEGVDKFTQSFTMRCRKIADYCTPGYLFKLANQACTLNNSLWFGTFQPRQVLFLGATTEVDNKGRVILNYTFNVGKIPSEQIVMTWNATLYEILFESAHVPQNVQWPTAYPSPHDYIWMKYAERVNNGQEVQTSPISVHLTQLYDMSDFTALELGGPWAPLVNSNMQYPWAQGGPWANVWDGKLLNGFGPNGEMVVPWVNVPNATAPDWSRTRLL